MANLIDVLTAVHVMKFEAVPEGWSPTNNALDADQILQQLHGDGVPSSTEDARAIQLDEDGEEIRVGPHRVKCVLGDGTAHRVEKTAGTHQMAICLAALERAGINAETGEKL
jgi:hypothetical protein